MDRKKYGEIIVDQIINDYKNSKEFRGDACNLIYRWLTTIINYKTASLGNAFVEKTPTCLELSEDAKKEFIEGMTKYNDLRAKMDELFDMLHDESNRDLYPCV